MMGEWPLDESVGGGPAIQIRDLGVRGISAWPKEEYEMADMQDETPETPTEEWERKDGRWLRLQALNAATRASQHLTTTGILTRANAYLEYLKTGEVPPEPPQVP